MANFTASQLKEIAAGLEASGHQFIWVVRRNKKSQEDKEDCLPQGFEERMEGKRLLSEDGHSKFWFLIMKQKVHLWLIEDGTQLLKA